MRKNKMKQYNTKKTVKKAKKNKGIKRRRYCFTNRFCKRLIRNDLIVKIVEKAMKNCNPEWIRM